MPRWQIAWTDQAVKDLSGLDRAVARRIASKVAGAASDPTRFFKRLVGADDYRLRVGDYRVIAMLSHESSTMLIERVAHRSIVYDR